MRLDPKLVKIAHLLENVSKQNRPAEVTINFNPGDAAKAAVSYPETGGNDGQTQASEES